MLLNSAILLRALIKFIFLIDDNFYQDVFFT